MVMLRAAAEMVVRMMVATVMLTVAMVIADGGGDGGRDGGGGTSGCKDEVVKDSLAQCRAAFGPNMLTNVSEMLNDSVWCLRARRRCAVCERCVACRQH